MMKLMRWTAWSFLAVYVASAIVTLLGVAYLLWKEPVPTPTYMEWLIGSCICQTVAVLVFIVRKGVSYIPDIHACRDREKNRRFLKEFIERGSTVQIVSRDISWIQSSDDMQKSIISRSLAGTRIEIFTPQEITDSVRHPLEEAGICFFVTGEDTSPEARFTLINGSNCGAEQLAIAKGSYPHREITVFDSVSGPQIIGMAKDIIRRSKDMANAKTLER
jgi:hypothetical protein